jgi:hypothetical protein
VGLGDEEVSAMQAEITEAFGYLRKAGHVNHGASNRPFHLSDAFKERMQVCIPP